MRQGGASPRGAVVALLSALALAGAACGESDEDEAGAQALGDVRVGSVAQLAQCEDWNGGERDEKLATIADIKEQINLQDAPVKTPELSDDAAYELLDSACAADYAAGFRLYKIYARATGFASFAD